MAARTTRYHALDTRSTRERAFDKLFATEHSDFKGVLADGTRTVMHWAKYGHGLATLATISAAELTERTGMAVPA